MVPLIVPALTIGYAAVIGDGYQASRLAVATFTTGIFLIINLFLKIYQFANWLVDLLEGR